MEQKIKKYKLFIKKVTEGLSGIIVSRVSRRKFFAWTSVIVGATVVAGIFQSIYSGIIFKTKSNTNLAKSKSKRRLKNREIWNIENLVLNTKTNVVHYPSENLFKYYNKIADKHISIIQFKNWKEQIKIPKHFIKSKSGIILENLALKELSLPLSNNNLQKAINTLTIAFSEQYKNNPKNHNDIRYQMNTCNWRLYHLLLQLIALNTLIPVAEKWSRFSEIIKHVDLKNIIILPKNNWIKSKIEFDKRIGYIEDNLERYTQRIEKRIKI